MNKKLIIMVGVGNNLCARYVLRDEHILFWSKLSVANNGT